MASPSWSSSCCCCFSSPHGLPRLTPTTTSTSRRIRLLILSGPSSRRPCSPIPVSSSSPEPPPKKIGPRPRRTAGTASRLRRTRPGSRTGGWCAWTPLQAVWATLTDYEALAGFIPGLSECRLLQQDHSFARLYQVGEQDLALGFKFNAKGTIDCYEGEIKLIPAVGRIRRREIAFNMSDGDFTFFQGKWSVQEEVDGSTVEQGGEEISEGFQITLSYTVELEPKLWVPVRLLEGRICSENQEQPYLDQRTSSEDPQITTGPDFLPTGVFFPFIC